MEFYEEKYIMQKNDHKLLRVLIYWYNSNRQQMSTLRNHTVGYVYRFEGLPPEQEGSFTTLGLAAGLPAEAFHLFLYLSFPNPSS